MNGIKLIRGFLHVVSLALFFGFVALFCFSYIGACFIGQRNPPPISEAPWAVQTSSRAYYGKEYRVINGDPAIVDYWTLDGKGKYRFIKGIMPFPKKEFGRIEIYRRTE